MFLNLSLLLQFFFQEKALKIIDLNVDPARLKVDIQAGPDGLFGAIQRMLGIDTKSGFTLDSTGCRRTTHGFINISRVYSPIPNLAVAVYFLVKPFGHLIVGLSMLLFGGFSTLMEFFSPRGPNFVFLGISALTVAISGLLLWKFLAGERTAVIGAMTNGSTAVSIKLKVPKKQFRTLQQAIAVIETVIAQGNATSTALSQVTPTGVNEDFDDLEEDNDTFQEPPLRSQYTPATPKKPVEEKAVITCPHCEAKLRLNSSILGKKIRCPACQDSFTAE